jgi:hypothetical protein
MTFEFTYKGTVAKNEIMLTAEFHGHAVRVHREEEDVKKKS